MGGGASGDVCESVAIDVDTGLGGVGVGVGMGGDASGDRPGAAHTTKDRSH